MPPGTGQDHPVPGLQLHLRRPFRRAALSARTVNDLNGPDTNGETYGGVPAIFKQFTLEAGLTDYDVSSELVGGKGLEYWFTVPETLARIQKPWDIVVMHGFSTLDQAHPGDRTLLLSSSKRIAEHVPEGKSQGKLWLFATWSRADQTYPEGTPLARQADPADGQGCPGRL